MPFSNINATDALIFKQKKKFAPETPFLKEICSC